MSNNLRYFFASFIIAAIAVFIAFYPVKFEKKERYGTQFQRVFNEKLVLIHNYFKRLENKDFEQSLKILKNARDQGITFLVFKGKTLVFWSDYTITLKDLKSTDLNNDSLITIHNTTYYLKTRPIENGLMAALIHLEYDYPYANRFLFSGMHPDFGTLDGSQIVYDNSGGDFQIVNENGEYAFSVSIKESLSQNKTRETIASVLLFLSIIIFLIYLFQYIESANYQIRNKRALIVIFVLLIIRIFFLLIRTGLSVFPLFDPYLYATKFAPSFGDLLVNTICILFISLITYRFIKLPDNWLNNQRNRMIFIILSYLLIIAVFLLAYYFSSSLIYDSNIRFNVSEIDNITFGTLIGFISFLLIFLSVGFIILWVFEVFFEKESRKFLLLTFVAVTIPLFIFLWLLGYKQDLYSVFFLLQFFIYIGLTFNKLRDLNHYSYSVLLLLIFSIYILVFTLHHGGNREKAVMRSLTESLANEHDPVAEYFFEDLSLKLQNDSIILALLDISAFDEAQLYDYVQKNYFSGYWNKYNLEIIVCSPYDSILFQQPDFALFHCYNFYDTVFAQEGLKIPDSDFYYLDNYTGIITYLGKITYPAELPLKEVSIFIELNSKISNENLGYPELLLDERFHQKTPLDQYSYAKYYQNNLMSHSGEFEYSLKYTINKKSKADRWITLKKDGYNHLIRFYDQDNIIIISKPGKKVFDILVNFSYIFVLYYALAILFIIIFRMANMNFKFLNNFRSKIQLTVISILLVSLILIGGSTIWFNINKYKDNQYRILREKIQSVYIEMEHKLAYEDRLTPNWSSDKYDNLGQLLIKFSDVFYSDINLYTPQGELLATSRGEVFDLGLIGNRMHPRAYFHLHNEKLGQYIHRERINKLSYLSAYVPFLNSRGELLAYLNLPYFTKQKELQEDITTLTVAIINIYVLLILLTIALAILISDQITKPLELIQAKFRNLKLGGRYEQIQYNREDEIGGLVHEYNRMVVELEKSVELLARSERESAWREMAKQIAHEIKNPLTPMRLSVQQLQRAWKDQHEDFGSYMERLAETLIEQIDNLSSIATEFSNFAKMPKTKLEILQLDKILQNTVNLFQEKDKYTIKLDIEVSDLYVEADKEQLSRVFLNLIKNGIQALPEDRKGKIDVNLNKEGKYAIIEISDNGKGIPEDIKQKLFIPNFTTKSSGMGLGLAIVRNILEQIEGDIDFTTEVGKGTTFFVKIPLKE